MPAFLQQLRIEFRAIFRDAAVLLTVVGGVLFYAVLYPQPYLNSTPREQSIAVIDKDNSATSRRLIRWANATPGVNVTHRVDSISGAKDLLLEGEVHGMFHIPRGFERDLTLSRSPVVGVAGDANYFLIYGTIIEGLVEAVGTISAEARIQEMILDGLPEQFAVGDWSPIKLNERPLFNVSIGYLGYVIPAIFILILQQTSLLASGLIGAKHNELRTKDASHEKGTAPALILSTRFTAMFICYFLLAVFYMGTCFKFYGISRVASIHDLLMMIAAFTAANAALGVLLGLLFPRRELVAPFVMIASLPLAFTAGFIWPIESLPLPVKLLSDFSPSTAGIQGFLKLNQMGASFDQVVNHWWTLWVLAGGYVLLAYWILQWRSKR